MRILAIVLVALLALAVYWIGIPDSAPVPLEKESNVASIPVDPARADAALQVKIPTASSFQPDANPAEAPASHREALSQTAFDTLWVQSLKGEALPRITLTFDWPGRDAEPHRRLRSNRDGEINLKRTVDVRARIAEALKGDSLGFVVECEGRGILEGPRTQADLAIVSGELVLRVDRQVTVRYRIPLDEGSTLSEETPTFDWLDRPGQTKGWNRSGGSINQFVPESWLPSRARISVDGYLPIERDVPSPEPGSDGLVDLGTIELVPINPPATGQLRLFDGTPLGGVELLVLDSEDRIALTAKTDADGRYVLQGLTNETYQLRLDTIVVGPQSDVLPIDVHAGIDTETVLDLELFWLRFAVGADGKEGLIESLAKRFSLAVSGPNGAFELLKRGYLDSDGEPFWFLAKRGTVSEIHMSGLAWSGELIAGSARIENDPGVSHHDVRILVSPIEGASVTLRVSGEPELDWTYSLVQPATGLRLGERRNASFELGHAHVFPPGHWEMHFTDVTSAISDLIPAPTLLTFDVESGEERTVFVPVETGTRIRIDLTLDRTDPDSLWKFRLDDSLRLLSEHAGTQTTWFAETENGLQEMTQLGWSKAGTFYSEALAPGAYQLVLTENGEVVYDDEVHLSAGKETVIKLTLD